MYRTTGRLGKGSNILRRSFLSQRPIADVTSLNFFLYLRFLYLKVESLWEYGFLQGSVPYDISKEPLILDKAGKIASAILNLVSQRPARRT